MIKNQKIKARPLVAAFMFLYFVSIVLFDNPLYINYFYATNLLLIFVYLGCKAWNGNFEINSNFVINFYLLLTIFALCSVMWSDVQVASYNRAKTMLLIWINLFFVYNMIRDFKIFEPIFHGIIFGVLVNFLIAFNLINIGWESMEGWRFQGTTVKSNVLANICVFSTACSLFFFSKDHPGYKIYGFFGVLIALYIVILTASKKGLGGVLLISLLFLLFKKGSLRSLLLLIGLSLLLFIIGSAIDIHSLLLNNSSIDISYLSERLLSRLDVFFSNLSGEGGIDKSTQYRMELVSNAMEMWGGSPLLGVGVGGFEIKYGAYAHNNYADLLANLGLIGFFLYYFIYCKFIFIFITTQQKTNIHYLFIAFLLVLIVSEFAIVTYMNKTLMLFILIASVMIVPNKGKRG